MDRGQRLDTPLHAAARRSSAEVIHLLADYGAPLKCRNAEGKSALDLATPNSSVEQALLLREGKERAGCPLPLHKHIGSLSFLSHLQASLPLFFS